MIKKVKTPPAAAKVVKTTVQEVTPPVTAASVAVKQTVITKKDLIRLIAIETIQKPKVVQTTLDTMLKIMSVNLANGAKIAMMGFGTFIVRTRKPRAGINPKTKDKITIGESTTVGFRAGTGLKKQVSNE